MELHESFSSRWDDVLISSVKYKLLSATVVLVYVEKKILQTVMCLKDILHGYLCLCCAIAASLSL